MKQRMLKPATAMLAFVLMTAGIISDATADPSPSCARCLLQYQFCLIAGGTLEACTVRFESCLDRYGCPLP